MTHLIVLGYENRFRAGQVLAEVRRLQQRRLLYVRDAGFVTKDHRGEVELHGVPNRTVAWALTHGVVGLLAGAAFFAPEIGLVIGASIGGAAGTLVTINLDQRHMREVGGTLNRNASALFLLVALYAPQSVQEVLRPYGGSLLHTTLPAQEANELMLVRSG